MPTGSDFKPSAGIFRMWRYNHIPGVFRSRQKACFEKLPPTASFWRPIYPIAPTIRFLTADKKKNTSNFPHNSESAL